MTDVQQQAAREPVRERSRDARRRRPTERPLALEGAQSAEWGGAAPRPGPGGPRPEGPSRERAGTRSAYLAVETPPDRSPTSAALRSLAGALLALILAGCGDAEWTPEREWTTTVPYLSVDVDEYWNERSERPVGVEAELDGTVFGFAEDSTFRLRFESTDGRPVQVRVDVDGRTVAHERAARGGSLEFAAPAGARLEVRALSASPDGADASLRLVLLRRAR